jgi:hypothetical protein
MQNYNTIVTRNLYCDMMQELGKCIPAATNMRITKELVEAVFSIR